MDTLFLETFLAVIDCGSIAAAARQLDLAPTTVAQQIKALEKQLDNALLRRSGHTVKPTAAAHRIIERARLIVREARDLRASASSGVLPVGPLRLGATQYALMQLLPPALHEWRRRYPEIEIYIEPGNSQELGAGGEWRPGCGVDRASVVRLAQELRVDSAGGGTA